MSQFQQIETDAEPPCVRYEASLELRPLPAEFGATLFRSLVVQLWGDPSGAHGTLEYEVEGSHKELATFNTSAELFTELTGHEFPKPAKQTPSEWAVAAIRARLDGVWDDPALVKLGPMSTMALVDIGRIMDAAEAMVDALSEDQG